MARIGRGDRPIHAQEWGWQPRELRGNHVDPPPTKRRALRRHKVGEARTSLHKAAEEWAPCLGGCPCALEDSAFAPLQAGKERRIGPGGRTSSLARRVPVGALLRGGRSPTHMRSGLCQMELNVGVEAGHGLDGGTASWG